MLNPKIFPSLLIFLSCLASIAYGVRGDARHCIYWLAAATLTFVVTF